MQSSSAEQGNFRLSPNFLAGATRAPAQLLPPCAPMKFLKWSKFSRWLGRWQPIEGSFVSWQGTLCTLATSRKPVSHHVTDSSLCHRFPQWSDKDKDMDWDKDNDKTLDNHRTNYFAASRGCCPHSFVCLVFLDAGWSKLWKPGKRSWWFWGGCLKCLGC